MSEKNEIIKNEKGILESVLFASGKEVSINILSSAINKDIEYTQNLLEEIRKEKKGTGIELHETNGSYILATNPKYADIIYKIFDERKKPTLSKAQIEVLAIIAYNPNISRNEIDTIRGISSSGVLSKLIDYELVEDVGKLDKLGKPTGYSVTNKFLLTFGIKSLKDLPELPKITEKDLFS